MKPPAYRFQRADLGKIKTYPFADRKSLVTTGAFANLDRYKKSGAFADLLPAILKGVDLKAVARAILAAKEKDKPVVIGMGAHVIKCGLSPLLIDLMERGIIDALAMNGAGAVHDLEIAFFGETSEDVAAEIREGRFGMVEETGGHLNGALARYVPEGAGMGEAVGRYLVAEKAPNLHLSLFGRGAELAIPVTCHAAIGTDIAHIHPTVDGAITGQATHNDFTFFTGIVSHLGGGGVYLNIGSAVLLPEVFIKALSAARNLGAEVTGFTTVDMDMLQHYRPGVNVVNRPIQGAGAGYRLTGHHEIMIPLLYHLLTSDNERGVL